MSDFELIIGNYNYSSWSLRSWLLLKKLDIDFTTQRLALFTEQGMSHLKQLSPNGKVPVLKHGSMVVWDSMAIAEYLAEIFPERQLWPEDFAARTWARSMCAEMHSGFSALRTELPMNCRAQVDKFFLSQAALADVKRIESLWLQTHEKFPADGGYLFGQFSIVDAFFAPIVSRFKTYAVNLQTFSQAYVSFLLNDSLMLQWYALGKQETEFIAGSEAVLINNQKVKFK